MPVVFTKGLGETRKENDLRGRRKPLRTLKELCAEVDVPVKSMAGFLSVYAGPKAALNGRANKHKAMWYDPDTFRAWWKETKVKIDASRDPATPKKTYPRKPKERKVTNALAMQRWLREHGPATVKQIRAAGFTGVYGGASQRMVAFGSLRKEGTGRSVVWIATDVDYIPPRTKKETT